MLTKWQGEKNSQQFEKCLANDEEKRILNGLRNAQEKNSQQFEKSLPNGGEKTILNRLRRILIGFRNAKEKILNSLRNAY